MARPGGPSRECVSSDVVIVGAGHAGVQLAVSLAKGNGSLSVTLLSGEKHLPYERPPLTKRQLYGVPDGAPIPLRSADYWARSPVELRLGERVVGIDPLAHRVITEAGTEFGYRTLVWAAGGSAARPGLPGERSRGVHSIRDFDDLVALKSQLRTARSAAIVGGGYVGLETAAALASLGLAVTVVEMAPRLLARVTGTDVSQFFSELHRSRGVDVRLGVGVSSIVVRDGVATGLALTDGTAAAADVVVAGVGMRPNVAALVDAGATGDARGVVVDAQCRTSLTDVFAIGDCAVQRNPWVRSDLPIRIESVHNAGLHAATVTSVLCGSKAVPRLPPRFWSTQFGNELKTVGMPHPDDQVVVRGDPAAADFSVVYLRDGTIAAVDTVNRPRDFGRAQGLIAARWRPDDRSLLADSSIDLPRSGAPHSRLLT